MKRLILFISGIIFSATMVAQSLAINTDGSTASTSAMLDVKSTVKGMLIPRMSKAQRNAIASPATGLIIFQNAPDSTGIYYYTGTKWQWMEESGNAWSLNGNAGTSPFSNLVGTSDATDLAIGAQGIPRMYVTREAEVGIGFADPLYGLDVTTGNAAINNCAFNGIRVKSVAAGFSNICERGLFMGYPDPNTASNEALVWNFGQANTGIKTLSLGVGSVLTMMRLTSDGLAGIGSGAMQPKYALDVNVGIGGVNPCGRNGLRLNNLLAANNPCEQGIFVGYDDIANRNKTSFWNFSADNVSTDRFIRFGYGTDFSEAPGIGESMRILPPGKGVGINQLNPLAMLHISNYTASGALPGVMATSPTLPPGTMGFYAGLRFVNNDGYVWNYQNAPVLFGTNDLERMRVAANGNVGIGTDNPAKQTEIIGTAVGTPVTLVVGNRSAFGPASMEFVSDYGLGSQWRPGYIRSNDLGSFTGSLEFYTNGTGAGNLYGNVKGLEVRNGVTYTATGTVSSFSDERIKYNVRDFTGGLDIIKQINPVSFYYNNKSPFQTDKMQIGVLAQELEQVAPYMVDKNAAGDFGDLRSVNNQAYIFLLINAVKEQQKQLDEQRKMIEELKRK